MNNYLIIVLAILIGSYLLDMVANVLNVGHISTELPEEFKGYYDADKYSKSQSYLKDNSKFAVVTDSIVGDTAFAIDSRLTRLSSTMTGTGVEAELLSRFQSAGDALFELFGYGTNRVQTAGVSTELGLTGLSDITDTSAIQKAVETGRKRAQDIHKNLRIILGNIKVSLKRPNGPKEIDINLADIPVSVEFFLKFMADNVLSKDILDYPYFHFMNDLIAAVVGNMLGTECFG